MATERLSSAGRPTPLVTVAILDGEGRPVAAGERGEIVVRSSLVMAGYYKNPEATAEASAHGWHHTGDIGFLDDEGFLHIVDRAKDMIISGGFNVFSAEVEQALMAHPDVQDCAVVGLPDDRLGQRVVAVIQPAPGKEIDADALIGFVKERIGSVKAPSRSRSGPTSRAPRSARSSRPRSRRNSRPPRPDELGDDEGGLGPRPLCAVSEREGAAYAVWNIPGTREVEEVSDAH